MKVLNISSIDLGIPSEDIGIIQGGFNWDSRKLTNDNKVKKLIKIIKENNISALIMNPKEQKDLIDAFILENEFFHVIGIINSWENTYFTPNLLRPVYSVSINEVQDEKFHFWTKLKFSIRNYEKNIIQAKQTIKMEIKSLKDYELVSKADEILYKTSWKEIAIPKRDNPFIKQLDEMLEAFEQFLDEDPI